MQSWLRAVMRWLRECPVCGGNGTIEIVEYSRVPDELTASDVQDIVAAQCRRAWVPGAEITRFQTYGATLYRVSSRQPCPTCSKETEK